MLIGARKISPSPELGKRVYIIAEIGVNHDGSVEKALALTRAAAQAGADAIKMQFFQTDLLLGKAAKLAAYQRAAGETDPVAMLRRLELDAAAMDKVIACAHGLGLHAIVTVFDCQLVAHARAQAWDAFKSASPDIIHKPLLCALARAGKPMIVSTGASTLDEVQRAVGWLDNEQCCDRLALLQCVSSYPAPEAALEGIKALAKMARGSTAIPHGLPIGLSDHTKSIQTGASAVACGASLLERHLTYDRNAPGPDHRASLEPSAFAKYVQLARAAAFGSETELAAHKEVLDCERDVRELSRQSLTTSRALKAGHQLARTDLTFKRPGTGLAPWQLESVLGMVLSRDMQADELLTQADLVEPIAGEVVGEVVGGIVCEGCVQVGRERV